MTHVKLRTTWFYRQSFMKKKPKFQLFFEILNIGFFFQLLYLESAFLAVAYLMIANLARLEISVCCQVLVRSQYLVRPLSQRWITGGQTINPPIEGLLPPTGIEHTPFQNLVSKVDGLEVHATIPSLISQLKKLFYRVSEISVTLLYDMFCV